VGVEVTGTVKAGIAIWVFTLGADQTRTNTNTITVTFDRIPPESELAQVAQSSRARSR
jgi:hypothetical protein